MAEQGNESTSPESLATVLATFFFFSLQNKSYVRIEISECTSSLTGSPAPYI